MGIRIADASVAFAVDHTVTVVAALVERKHHHGHKRFRRGAHRRTRGRGGDEFAHRLGGAARRLVIAAGSDRGTIDQDGGRRWRSDLVFFVALLLLLLLLMHRYGGFKANGFECSAGNVRLRFEFLVAVVRRCVTVIAARALGSSCLVVRVRAVTGLGFILAAEGMSGAAAAAAPAATTLSARRLWRRPSFRDSDALHPQLPKITVA